MATVSSGSKAERFRFIDNYGSELGVRYLCDWLEVSSAGYYKWKKRAVSERDKYNLRLSDKIVNIFEKNDGNYGSPRVYRALRKAGIQVNHKRVERIMQEMGLVGKAAKIYRRKAPPDKFYTKLPNLKKDLPKPSAPNQQWVGDLTYLKVSGKFQYLAVVMDLYSRRIVGWSLSEYKSSEVTRESLRRALKYRRVQPDLIFHTDRGSEYGAYIVQKELEDAKIHSSMNRPGYITDNAHMESFFRSLKTECIKGVKFDSVSDLRMVLSDYIDVYYNKKRLHSGIGYLAPCKYERRAA